MIVFPMVGRSSRFFHAGYSIPKYQLPLYDGTVFDYSVRSFEEYFQKDFFVFLVRSDFNAADFVKERLKKIGIKNYALITFSAETLGQADTIYHGLKGLGRDDPLYIFNIDTFRPGFLKPKFVDLCDGYLEVFVGEGEHWSFVEPQDDSRVKRTTEKVRVSNLCSDGLYYFRSAGQFSELMEEALSNSQTTLGEYYVAPLYNSIIARGGDVRYQIVNVSNIGFCGTPQEYSVLLGNSLRG